MGKRGRLRDFKGDRGCYHEGDSSMHVHLVRAEELTWVGIAPVGCFNTCPEVRKLV